MSANALRKLLPPSQRVVLGPLSIDEALAFQPLGVGTSHPHNRPTDTGCASLAELLEEVRLDVSIEGGFPDPFDSPSAHDAAVDSLRSLLVAKVPQASGTYAYTGASILAAPPRHLSDLWHLLDSMLREAPSISSRLDSFLRILAEEARRAFDEEERLPIAFRERFLEAVSFTPDGVVDLWAEELVTGSRMTIGSEIELDTYRRLAARRFRGWHVSAPEQPEKKVGDRSLSLLVLLNDLLALKRETGVGGRGLAPDSFRLGWAQTLWFVRAGAPVRISWPAPSWQTFFEFDLMRQTWDSLRLSLSAIPDAEEQALALIHSWINANTAVLHGASPAELQRLVDDTNYTAEGLSKQAWWRLVDRVSLLVSEYARVPTSALSQRGRTTNPHDVSRRDVLESWFVGLACLLAPETGLPARRMHAVAGDGVREGVSEAFCEVLAPAWSVPAVAAAIRTHRAKRLTPFIVAQAPQFFRALTSAWPVGMVKQFSKLLTAVDPVGSVNRLLRQAWRDTELSRRIKHSAAVEEIEALSALVPAGILRLARLANANPVNGFASGDLCPGPGEERSVNTESDLLSAEESRRDEHLASRVLNVILDDLKDEE